MLITVASSGLQSYVLHALLYGWAYGAFMYGLKLYVNDVVRQRSAEMAQAFISAVLGAGTAVGPVVSGRSVVQCII